VTYQKKLLFTKNWWKGVYRRQIFITDMIEEIQKIKEAPNNMCILMFESIKDSSGAIRKLIAETTLVDTFD
jgi:hypothetical protein